MMKYVVMCLQLVVILLFMVVIGVVIYYFPVQVTPEYSAKIYVDKPDKIENAISNVVSDLRKRDFVPVRLEVTWHPSGKIYVVDAKGIDRTKLSKYEL